MRIDTITVLLTLLLFIFIGLILIQNHVVNESCKKVNADVEEVRSDYILCSYIDEDGFLKYKKVEYESLEQIRNNKIKESKRKMVNTRI